MDTKTGKADEVGGREAVAGARMSNYDPQKYDRVENIAGVGGYFFLPFFWVERSRG